MLFQESKIAGAWIVGLEPRNDARGFFARSFCTREFQEHGIPFAIVQSNLAFAHRRGTVRGLHFQAPPSTEGKLIRCSRGAIFDVIVDLREDSPTRWHHFAVELTAENHQALFVPPGVGHGYQTLSDQSEVSYLVSDYYTPGCEGGVRYDDPAFGISWPLPPIEISPKDLAWPLLGTAAAKTRI